MLVRVCLNLDQLGPTAHFWGASVRVRGHVCSRREVIRSKKWYGGEK